MRKQIKWAEVSTMPIMRLLTLILLYMFTAAVLFDWAVWRGFTFVGATYFLTYWLGFEEGFNKLVMGNRYPKDRDSL